MKAAILSVGTELLMGQITNTNTVYLSRALNLMGIDVMYHHTVGDNPKRLAEMIRTAFEECELVITTGGLGPTQDDMTKEIACEVLGDELVMHPEILQSIKERMSGYKIKEMTPNNIKQAEMPKRAVIFRNSCGTAPGFALEDTEGAKAIICMPGPPREMTTMFEKSIAPWLAGKADGKLFFRELRCFGIGESELETVLLPLIDGQTDPTLATYAKESECSVRIASKRSTVEEAKAAVDEMTDKVCDIVGKFVYSKDNEELPKVVCKELLNKGLTVASAESCTGGMFAAAVTDIPGSSDVFPGGYVTYSNEAKMRDLGVKKETLDEFGAVSEETAMEMAEGVAKRSGSDIGISVTGIAGPGGGSEEKPVGLAYVGFVYGDSRLCKKIDRRINERARNRKYAVMCMFDMILRNI